MRERCGQAAPTLILAALWLVTAGLIVWTVRLCSGS